MEGSAPEPSPTAGELSILSSDEECPLCGADNRCRVAKGLLYKGPCWCHEIIVPGQLLARLAMDRLKPACLCRACLETVARIAGEGKDIQTILAEIEREVSSRRASADEGNTATANQEIRQTAT